MPAATAASGAIRSTLPKPCPADDSAQMRWCDTHFAPLMLSAMAGSEALTEKVPSKPEPEPRPAPDDPAAMRAEAEKRMRQSLNRVQNRALTKAIKKGFVPEIGLGPRIFIGFDAEWVFVKKGKNRLLSIQFYLIGPTGEVLTRVIHVSGPAAAEERPSLRQSLLDLIEEALDEDVIEEWPSEVVLCGFFTRADITVFSDFKKFRHQLDGVGGSLVTVAEPARIELPMSFPRREQLKARYRLIVGEAYEAHVLNVRLLDASRLAPPGKSLDALGKWLGIAKNELPPGFSKGEMDKFQRKEPELFEAYGLRDAEIAVMYVLWTVWFSDRYLGLDMRHLSATASGLAVRMAETCIRKDGVALNVALNYDEVQVTRWDDENDRRRTIKKRIPADVRRWLEPFLADAYVGGRNECFTYGPSDYRRFYDPDLSGAYSTGLCYLQVLDYDRVRMTQDVNDFKGHVAGFAKVVFSFPADTRFPCLPVPTESRGLMFPLQGETLCTAPEIELALAMGAQVEVKFGIIIPWRARDEVFEASQARPGRHRRRKSPAPKRARKAAEEKKEAPKDDLRPDLKLSFPPPHHDDEGYRLFESFAIYIRAMRSQFIRKTLPFEFVKLIGNGLYGKTGQGFKGKRAFGPREMGSVIVGASRVSEAAVAALVCGFIRATLGEILWRLPHDAVAISATTDGFLVDRPINQLDLSGPICRRFQELVERVTPKKSESQDLPDDEPLVASGMLENKHQMMQVFAGRTRLQVTCAPDGNHHSVTAKGGVKPGPDVEDENAFMLDLIIKRAPGYELEYEAFISMRDQLTRDWDLQTETRTTRINMEFDFKRQPIPGSARMVEIAGMGASHLAFDTRPWPTAEDAVDARMVFDRWRATHCLKTLEDFADWQAYHSFYEGNRKRQKRAGGSSVGKSTEDGNGGGRVNLMRETGYVGVALRTFLAAYVKREWGLADADLSQSALAQWLTEAGYPTKLSAVKNGLRTPLQDHVVPGTEEVMTLLERLKARFPGLDTSLFLL